MLIENKFADQIFREKLVDYEKNPPPFLWTNIQEGLNARRRNHRIALLKTVGIAAAIVLAFIAGWQMTNSADKDNQKNIVAEHGVINNNVAPSTNKNTLATPEQPINPSQVTSNTSVLPPGVNRSNSSKLSSITAVRANTNLYGNDISSPIPLSVEPDLPDTEKDFLEKLHTNLELVKKLTDWIVSGRKDSVASVASNSSKAVIKDSFKNTGSNESFALAINTSVKNNGRWSLKAEIAPVFNNQSQNAGPKTDLISGISQNYKPQETTADNTFSGGLVAGYKVSKRLIVKSGLVYNNIRQTTRNLEFMGVNPLYNVPGNSTLAITPAGQVSLSKMGNAGMEAVLDSKFQLADSPNYPVENELKQNIEFIEIPVQATYKVIDTRFNLGLTGGISTNILVGNKAVLSGNGERISSGETSNMRSLVYSSAVGLEVGYEITHRISLTVEPRLKHFISSLSTNKYVNYRPYQMGIVTGLTYSFN